jgi:hypothetical protein
MLTYALPQLAQQREATYADVCGRMTYSVVCWRMLTYVVSQLAQEREATQTDSVFWKWNKEAWRLKMEGKN